MTTPYSEVFDSFMLTQTDYRLVNLFNQSIDDFETYLLGFLVKAIAEFSPYCNQSLARDDTTKTFTLVLTEENIEMLSMLMNKYWLAKEVKDISQIRMVLSDHDFKRTSEAMNIQAKQKLYNDMKEECSQRMVDYGYAHAPFSNWGLGIY
jgi:hypothetical protein